MHIGRDSKHGILCPVYFGLPIIICGAISLAFKRSFGSIALNIHALLQCANKDKRKQNAKPTTQQTTRQWRKGRKVGENAMISNLNGPFFIFLLPTWKTRRDNE